MKLLELLELLEIIENNNVALLNTSTGEILSQYNKIELLDAGTGEVLSRYNKKDSIPAKYNNCEVLRGNVYDGGLAVWIKNDVPVEYELTEIGLDKED